MNTNDMNDCTDTNKALTNEFIFDFEFEMEGALFPSFLPYCFFLENINEIEY